jgi:hypothetical protein
MVPARNVPIDQLAQTIKEGELDVDAGNIPCMRRILTYLQENSVQGQNSEFLQTVNANSDLEMGLNVVSDQSSPHWWDVGGEGMVLVGVYIVTKFDTRTRAWHRCLSGMCNKKNVVGAPGCFPAVSHFGFKSVYLDGTKHEGPKDPYSGCRSSVGKALPDDEASVNGETMKCGLIN